MNVSIWVVRMTGRWYGWKPSNVVDWHETKISIQDYIIQLNSLRDELVIFLEQKKQNDIITNESSVVLLIEKQVTIATENKS